MALCFSSDGRFLLAGLGAQLKIYYTLDGTLLFSSQIFSDCRLHELKLVPQNSTGSEVFLLVWGSKQAKIFSVYFPQDINQEQLKISLLFEKENFSDWVWDIILLPKKIVPFSFIKDNEIYETMKDLEVCAVGLAHNYVEIWNWKTNQQLALIKAEENSIMYCLQFFLDEDRNSLICASGSIFNQILLWEPLKSPQIKLRLIGHEGVIFRLKWSKEGTELFSVSDDRSTRIWKNILHIFHQSDHEKEVTPWKTFYGHRARVWDCIFMSPSTLITSGEDAVIVIWNIVSGEQVTSLHGHSGKNVWRIAVDESNSILASGGGDSAIRLWDIQSILYNSSTGSIISFDIPNTHVPELKKQKAEYVRLIKLINHNTAYIVTNRGFVYRLSVDCKEKEKQWTLVYKDSTSTFQSIAYYSDSLILDSNSTIGTTQRSFLFLGDATGRVTLVDLNHNTSLCWSTETTERIVFLHPHSPPSFLRIPLDNIISQKSSPIFVFVSRVPSHLQWWCLESTEKQPILFATFVISHKVTVWSVVIDECRQLLVCGDSKGSLHLFRIPTSITSEKILPIHTLRHVHEQERLSTIHLSTKNNKFLFTGGRNGYVCSFQYNEMNNNGENSIPLLVKVSQSKVYKNMEFIEKLFVLCESDKDSSIDYNEIESESSSDSENEIENQNQTNDKINEDNTKEKIIGKNESYEHLGLFGFYSTNAIFYDWKNQTVLYSIKCGGSKRPYDFHISFLSPNDREDQETENQITFAFSKTSRIHFFQSVPYKKKFQRSILHFPFHGKHTNSITLLNHFCSGSCFYFATTSEDTTVKIFRYEVDKNVMKCVQTLRGHTCSTRCSALSKHPKSENVLLFSGGGRLQLKVWKSSSSQLTFHQLAELNESKHSTVQCRIMTIVVVPLMNNNVNNNELLLYHLVIVGRSDSFVKLYIFDEIGNKFVLVNTLKQTSAILSMKILLQPEHSQSLLFVGTTDGRITVWNLNSLVPFFSLCHIDKQMIELAERKEYQKIEPIHIFLAHQCGVNVLDIVSLNPPQLYILVSGGDDQSLFVSLFETVSRSLLHDKMEFSIINERRFDNIHSSAISGIWIDLEREVILTVGQDQRLCLWTLHKEKSETPFNNESINITFRSGCVSEVAEIDDTVVIQQQQQQQQQPSQTTTNEQKHFQNCFVIVVGEGLQMLEIDL